MARARPDSPRRRQWPTLDGLRATVLLVAAYHFDMLGRPQSLGEGVYDVVLHFGAYVGMDMFFALSGFLITSLLLDSRDDQRYFRTFYGRRFLRIFPVYYLFLASWILLLPRLYPGHPGLYGLAVEQQAYYWTYTLNLQVLMPAGFWFGKATSHLWSLMVEEQFYLVWPLVVRFSTTRTLRRVAIAMVGLSPLLRIAIWFLRPDARLAGYNFTLSHCEGLALGALLAIQARSEGGLTAWIRPARRTAFVAIPTLLAIHFAAGGLAPPKAWAQTLGTFASSLLGAAIVLAALVARPEARGARLLAHPASRALGRVSYATYVMHWPLSALLDTLGIATFADFKGWLPGLLAPQLAYSATRYFATIALAFASWHLIEKRALAWRRHLPYGFEREEKPTVGAADSRPVLR